MTSTPNSLVLANEILEEEMRQLITERLVVCAYTKVVHSSFYHEYISLRKSPSALVNPSAAEMSKKYVLWKYFVIQDHTSYNDYNR